MSKYAAVQQSAGARARALRSGRHALMALTVIGSVACGETPEEIVTPPMPGSIVLSTETTGFLKDDSYELLVDGESQGTIGANDEVTIAELDPATYEVALGDVAANCTVAATSVEVVSEEAAAVSLAVVCAAPDPSPYTIRFSRERPNLDDGAITECPFSICPTEEDWDMWAYNNTGSTPAAVIRQNQTTSVEIAHLPGVTLGSLTEADVAGASFGTDLVADPFDPDRVILIRTDAGAVYALGNPVESLIQLTLTFDAVRIE